MNPNSPRQRRLTPAADGAPRLQQAPVQVTDINERQPPDLALVRLAAVGTPALRAPPPVEDEDAPLPDPEEVEEREVRQPIQIRMAGQALDRGGDAGVALTHVEPTRRGHDRTAQRQITTAFGVLERPAHELHSRNRNPCGVPAEALDLPGAEAAGATLDGSSPLYGSVNGFHSSSPLSPAGGVKPRSNTDRPTWISARTR